MMKLRFWPLSVFCASVLLSGFVFSAENSRGVPAYHQLISGDPDSYEAFDTTFLAWDRPILSLSKHSSLCYLDQSEPPYSIFEARLADELRKQGHRYVTAYAPCDETNGASGSTWEPSDYSKKYIFQGLTAEPKASMGFVFAAVERISDKNRLSTTDVSLLANYLGIRGEVADVYDFGLVENNPGTPLPYLTFTVRVNAQNEGVRHGLISVRTMPDGVWIYERTKLASYFDTWTELDAQIHGKSLSLLDYGGQSTSFASTILSKQSDMEEAYFFENVAFALKSEFEVNNFGFPILLQYFFESEKLGHVVDVIDADSVYKEGDWLYFTKARFVSTLNEKESGDNLATNLPIVMKVRMKASCDNRRVASNLSGSLGVTGRQSEWFEMNSPFEELNLHSQFFVMAFCKSLVSKSDSALIMLEKFNSLFSGAVFEMSDYQFRSMRLWYEHMTYSAE